MFDCVERARRDAGFEVWPTPRIRDYSSWLREHHLRRQLSDSSALRVLNDVEERELWRLTVQGSRFGDGFLEPSGAAAAARAARRTMVDYGIPTAALAAHPSEESQALAEWIRAFDARCRALGCVRGDELPQDHDTAPEPIAWIESPAWRPVARRWLERHGGQRLLPAAESSSSGALLEAANPNAELAAIAAWARSGLQSSPNFRAWICVPELGVRRDELRDAFDAALAPQRLSLHKVAGAAAYALAGGSPLSEFASVRIALDTLDLARGLVPFERFSALLRAAEFQATGGDATVGDATGADASGADANRADASGAMLLDVGLRARAPSELPVADWLVLAERVARELALPPIDALVRLRDALAALDRLQGAQPLSRWVPLWISAFESGPWVHRRRWSSGEFQSAERLRELLSTLASADRLFGNLTRPAAERLLAAAARDTPFQAQTGIPPIWVSGAYADPWLRYDALWIAGLSEDRWPARADPNPLLPIALQKQYGVAGATAQSQLQIARELQQCWRSRAPQVVFSCAKSEAAGASLPSPLLPADLAPLLLEAAAPQPHWLHGLRDAPQLENIVDEMAPPFAQPERTRGVASLREQSRCAFRGFSHTRLRSDELARPIPGFSPMERGQLVHDALERIWSTLRDSARLETLEPGARALLLDSSVAAAIAAIGAVRDPGERWRRREQRRTRNLLERWLEVERRREAFSVERLEQSRMIARHAGVDFECRVDRVDRLRDGARVLIDYKTGSGNADWRGERPDNPQLPIYAQLFAERLIAVAYGLVNAADIGFLAESERNAVFGPQQRRSKLEGLASFEGLLGLWSARIERLAAEFAAGHAQVAPTLQACSSCHLQGLCRITANHDE